MGTCLAWLACTCVRAQAPPAEIVLRNFGGAPPNGSGPHAGLIIDSAGNFYGTTEFGGAAGQGVVFKLDPTGHQTVLYSFTGGNDGGQPTYAGGSAGLGAIFKLDPSGHETVLHSFLDDPDGDRPLTGVVIDPAGNLYGATQNDAAEFYGVVYKLDTGGNYDVLHAFTNGADGSSAQGVILDSAGNLDGAAARGGANGDGVVFKLDPVGNETVLYNFTAELDTGVPASRVIRDAAGNLYGVGAAVGTGFGGVYKLRPAGHLNVLYDFTAASVVFSGLARDAAGNLYGTTKSGGPANCGTIYKLDAVGGETLLYSFSGTRYWAAPLRRADAGFGRQPLWDDQQGRIVERRRGIQA